MVFTQDMVFTRDVVFTRNGIVAWSCSLAKQPAGFKLFVTTRSCLHAAIADLGSAKQYIDLLAKTTGRPNIQ